MTATVHSLRPPKPRILPQDPTRRVPERLDEVHFPSGHIWRRDPQHEALVLRVKRAICYGEGVGG